MHYCGIDIAKRKHVLAVVDEKGEIVKAPFSVDNSRAGFEQLRDVLVAIPGQLTVGLEATGLSWPKTPSARQHTSIAPANILH
ncbi:MAG: transposase [Chloroflexi bacterium]|nr:transposase [Chloroflexota bacterium]